MSNRKVAGISLGLVWAILALGCGQRDDAPQNLLEGQKRAMDKASAVEDQLKQAAEQQKSTIDEQTR